MIALEAIAGGIGYAALAFFAGALVTAGFLLPAGEGKLRKSLVRLAFTFLLLFLATACFALLIQGAKLSGGKMPLWEILWRYLRMTQSGTVWLARESYGIALAVLILRLLKRQATMKSVRLLAVLALPLLAGRSLSSHAVAVREDTALAVASDAIHLVATGLWGGGLLAVLWVVYRGSRDSTVTLHGAAETVRRFSLLALASVAVLFISGFYQSWLQVGSLETLFATGYGRVLVIKLSLFIVMVSLGAVNWLFTKPRLLRAARERREEASAERKALTRIGAEAVLALLVFFVTGLLTVLPPGVHAVHQAARAAPAQAPEPAKLQPAEGASVQILSPGPGQVLTSDQVPLRFKLIKGRRGDHVHAYIDGELMGMFMSKQGTLNGISPGRHTLELRVVAGDHQTELAAQDRVEFIVKGKEERK